MRPSLTCAGGLPPACAVRRPSSRAVCITCSLRRQLHLRLAADITPSSRPLLYLQSSRLVNLRLAPTVIPSGLASASTSGLRRRLRSLAVLPISYRLAPTVPSSARTGDQLPTLIAGCTPTRLQYNSRLAPDVTRFGSAEDSTSGLRRLLHPSAKLATNCPVSIGCHISGLRRLPASHFHRVLSPPVQPATGFRLSPDPGPPIIPVCTPQISPDAGPFGLSLLAARLAPNGFPARLAMNFRLRLDLASSAELTMSIPSPPSVTPPDHQWLTLRLSPSVTSSGSASNPLPNFRWRAILWLGFRSTLQLTLAA